MKKVIIATTLIFALYTTASADTTVDYVRSDGSATRVTYGTDWTGRNTVTTTNVSSGQRNAETVVAVVVWILKVILGGGGK